MSRSTSTDVVSVPPDLPEAGESSAMAAAPPRRTRDDSAIETVLLLLARSTDADRLAVIEALEDDLEAPRLLYGCTAAARQLDRSPATIRRAMAHAAAHPARRHSRRPRVILAEAGERRVYGLSGRDVQAFYAEASDASHDTLEA